MTKAQQVQKADFTCKALPVFDEGELPAIRSAQARQKRVKRSPTDFEGCRTC
jgi:hypothetical protein